MVLFSERFFGEPKMFFFYGIALKTHIWNSFWKSVSGFYIYMVSTFDKEDFVLQWTLKCCINMFWNLRPEAFNEM